LGTRRAFPNCEPGPGIVLDEERCVQGSGQLDVDIVPLPIGQIVLLPSPADFLQVGDRIDRPTAGIIADDVTRGGTVVAPDQDPEVMFGFETEIR